MELGIKSLFKGFYLYKSHQNLCDVGKVINLPLCQFFPNNIMDFNSRILRNLLAL